MTAEATPIDEHETSKQVWNSVWLHIAKPEDADSWDAEVACAQEWARSKLSFPIGQEIFSSPTGCAFRICFSDGADDKQTIASELAGKNVHQATAMTFYEVMNALYG